MRKLMLTDFSFRTGENVYTSHRLVLINHNEGDTEDDQRQQATERFKEWFPKSFPESELLSIVSYPTIGRDEEKVSRRKRAVLQIVHKSNEHPIIEQEGKSVNVIIDHDGRKVDFSIGWYDYDKKEWCTTDDAKLDLEHMVWVYNPLTHS